MRAALALIALAACGGEPAILGLDEPIRVRGGRFLEGALPGLPPDEGAPPSGPAITIIESVNNTVQIGQARLRLSGRTSTDGAAVGVALAGLGTGYWVVPVGPPDPTAGNEYTWELDASVGWELPLGPGAIELVAIGDDGTAGRRSSLNICVRPQLPDNASACDTTIPPPDTVLSLTWDADVDLDLRVRTPEDVLVSPDHPSTIATSPITAADLRAEHVGLLDRDSNRGCAIDGLNREDLVWQTPPIEGTYLVYAGLSDACGQASVRFTATLYQARDNGDGTSQLVEISHQDGVLLGASADGGAGPGLFLLQLGL
ncbi:MAG: hypothetical protein K8W52_07870 [Deltaproteobacteria bacterium]|nr:hypothetical protein [Deltaproteobacteria bacterium]